MSGSEAPHHVLKSPPATWPTVTREGYIGLQTYHIAGASACAAAIMRALQALSEHLATKGDGSAYGALRDGGARFCALKPDTAAYVNAVHWLLAGLDERSAPADIAATVARRVEAYTAHRRLSLDRIRDQACRLLPVRGNVLIHDYSSTVLAVIAEAGQRGLWLRVYVTAGAPHMRA